MDISAGVSTTSTEPMIASTEQIFSAVAWLIYLGMKMMPQM